VRICVALYSNEKKGGTEIGNFNIAVGRFNPNITISALNAKTFRAAAKAFKAEAKASGVKRTKKGLLAIQYNKMTGAC